MRPVNKLNWPEENGVRKIYKPHPTAKADLESNLDCFCSYCEVFSSDLEVEHIISQHQNSALLENWENFLLACGRCNGRDNKTNKPVDLSKIHFPHLNNTYLSFVYKEGGLVIVNPTLIGDSRAKATNMINLVGLDKIPGNPKYPNLNLNDTRWRHRRLTWEWAERLRLRYEKGELSAKEVVDFATQRGFFSVWFTVYESHPDVKHLLIDNFIGTAQNCFDTMDNYKPIARNPLNLSDPV